MKGWANRFLFMFLLGSKRGSVIDTLWACLPQLQGQVSMRERLSCSLPLELPWSCYDRNMNVLH